MRLVFLPIALAFGIAASPAAALAAGAGTVPEPVRAALESKCLDCHDDSTAKGKFSLESLPPAFDDAGKFHHWQRVFDQIADGQMPPKKKAQPTAKERDAMLGWLRTNLHAASLARQKAEGRVASRRLNRTEYENSLRELFGVPLHVQDLLPEGGSAGGAARRRSGG